MKATPPVFGHIAGAESEALEDFLGRVRPRLKKILRRYEIPPADAEDLLQEALLGAVLKWNTIRHLEAWLIGTLQFICAKYWKRQRRREAAVDPEVLEELCESEAPAQDRVEELLDLRNLTRGLCKRHRAMLWLRFYVGMSPVEVARRLGYQPCTVRKLTHRALGRLQATRQAQRSCRRREEQTR